MAEGGREAGTERTRIEASMLFARYFALVIIINVHFYELHFTSHQPSDNMIETFALVLHAGETSSRDLAMIERRGRIDDCRSVIFTNDKVIHRS